MTKPVSGKADKPGFKKPKISSAFMGSAAYKCQYCLKESPVKKWRNGIICPNCRGVYDAILAQESDD